MLPLTLRFKSLTVNVSAKGASGPRKGQCPPSSSTNLTNLLSRLTCADSQAIHERSFVLTEKDLPALPNLDHYRKQSKDLLAAATAASVEAISRIVRHHPQFQKPGSADAVRSRIKLADAQLVVAREHGFESWPKFAKHIETLHLIESLASLPDPVSAFLEVACVPRHASHASGTLDHAQTDPATIPRCRDASNIYISRDARGYGNSSPLHRSRPRGCNSKRRRAWLGCVDVPLLFAVSAA